MEEVEPRYSLSDWVQYLSKKQMPALAETVQKLNRLTTDENSRVSNLTEQILKDPSLTSRVLRVSNSVMYKGSAGQIKTISRAIVMLGFATVRDVTLSMQILDNVLKHQPSHYLMTQIANSFHAAMQARGMLLQTRIGQQEEVFISSLLLHFAELSILSRDDEVSRKLNHKIEREKLPPEQAALSVLGCSFDEISSAIAKQWELGDVLLEALSRPKAPSQSVQAVLLGDELSQVALLGWETEPVRDVVSKIAKYRNMPFKDAMNDVISTAALAHEMAVHYGAAKVKHLIPHPETKAPLQAEGNPGANVKVEAKVSPGGERQEKQATALLAEEGIEDMIELALGGGGQVFPDSATEYALKQGIPKNDVAQGVANAEMQLAIMQKISVLIAEKRTDMNEMLNLVLDGMCDAVGLERVVFSLTSRDRKKLVPRFFRGDIDEATRQGFAFQLDEENAFSVALLQSLQLWMGSKLMAGRAFLHTAQLQKVLSYKEYFIAPVIVARKPIGVFYGDCANSKRPLNDQQFAVFNMFAQQTGLALGVV